MKKYSARLALFVGMSLYVTMSGRAAIANGDSFFGAEEIPGQTEFVYFGSVKDTDGNYLEGVEVTLDVADPPLTYVAYTDVIGRFRTLDAGRAVVDLGYEVDTSKFSLYVARDGYKQVRKLDRTPRRAKKGAYEVNFVMEAEPNKAKKALQSD
jgi:hypothetical protein